MEAFFLNLGCEDMVLTFDDGSITSPYNPRLVKVAFDDPPIVRPSYLFYKQQSGKPLVRKFVETCHRVAEGQKG
jgi:hypothetical protein